LLSATVLDSGDGVTHCIPIIDGRVFKAQIERLNLAGRHVTQYLTKLLLLRWEQKFIVFNLSSLEVMLLTVLQISKQ